MSIGIRFDHCADYDRFGVQITQPETLRATHDGNTITLGIGVDQLTRKTYTMTAGEARRLADWINRELGRNE